jgi:hypothetical protein
MFIGVTVGLKARLCSSARCRQLRPQNIGTHPWADFDFGFAPAASDGARPHDSPIRRFNNILNAELRTIFARFFIPDVPD